MKTIHQIERKPSRRHAAHKALAFEGDVTRHKSAAEIREAQVLNRASMAVQAPQDFPDESEFFARPKDLQAVVSSEALCAMDAALAAHGVRNVLLALSELCESRIEDGTFRGDVLILHLSRSDSFARVAERLQTLAFSDDAKECDAK